MRATVLVLQVGEYRQVPDFHFQLCWSGRYFNLLYEIDNATEPLDSQRDTSIRTKILGYESYQNWVLKRWMESGRQGPRPSFRVAFLTTGSLRANHILWLAGSLSANRDRRLIYATTQDVYLGEAHAVTEPIFNDHLGGWQSLINHQPTSSITRQPIRLNPPVVVNAASRIAMVGRIFDAHRAKKGLPPNGPIQYASLELFEYAQDRLLAGDEGRFETRAPMSVNSVLTAVMAFLRYCERHKWLDEVPPLPKLDVDEVMKGRPLTEDEYKAMLEAVPAVVGKLPSAPWQFVLEILWESAFRVGDVMNFSWDDPTKTHPIWPRNNNQFPTRMVSSHQKNKKAQEIPMLPGLQALLEKIPAERRRGWVANPLPLERKGSTGEPPPFADDLRSLTRDYSNISIAKAFKVTEAAVRKWLSKAKIERQDSPRHPDRDIPKQTIAQIRQRTRDLYALPSIPTESRLTTEHVAKVISKIEQARIVVQQPDEEQGRRVKYASAHDLRRGRAYRLINAGVSAETLKIILRHDDFKTTERFYGAIREAQSAAIELRSKLENQVSQTHFELTELNNAQLSKLKKLLDNL